LANPRDPPAGDGDVRLFDFAGERVDHPPAAQDAIGRDVATGDGE
jgi:hypothetical protein